MTSEQKKAIYKAADCTDTNDCLIAIEGVKSIIQQRSESGKSTRAAYRRLISLEKKLKSFQ